MSANLIQKSKENFQSAKVLIDSEMWNASIHCSYYACLQLLKVVIYKLKSQRIVDQQLKSNTASTHKYLINCLISDLAGKAHRNPDAPIALDLTRDLTDLKSRRESADYSPELVDENSSKQAQIDAQKIIETLTTFYAIK